MTTSELAIRAADDVATHAFVDGNKRVAAAAMMASAIFFSVRPRSRFVLAAARLMRPIAWIIRGGNGQPLIGKFVTARCVCTP